jgi:tripartite-type tricarboxylate transporter receptor subunit TctC
MEGSLRYWSKIEEGGTKMVRDNKVFFFGVFCLFALSVLWPAQGYSQERYPTKAIEIIVPFTAGGSTDLLARFVAESLKQKWGVPVNVSNKPGGNTMPAQIEVYQAKPDGYTIFSDSQSSCSLLELAVKDSPIKVLDRTFIAFTTASPSVFWVPASSPIKNLKELEAEIKKDPGNFTWTSFGGVGAGDFTMRQLFKAMGVDVNKTKPVVTRGGSDAVVMVAGGHVKLGTSSPVSGISHVKAGTVRVLAVSGGSRVQEFPNVASAVEQGYPAINAIFWTGFSGPPKLPSNIIQKWDEALRELLKDQTFLSKISGVGLVPFYHDSSKAREYVRKEMDEAAKLWGVK